MKFITDENGMRWCEPDCVDEYLFGMWAISFDYDGRTSVDDLKDLIDELVVMAQDARECLWEGHLFGIHGEPESVLE